jgi:ATP-dependent Clp protease ATP-binding subunit ClpB
VQFGYNKIFGARELRRVIQDNIEDELAKYIIEGTVKSGSVVEFDGMRIVKIV